MKGDCLRPNLIFTNIHTKIKQQKKKKENIIQY